MNLQVMDRTTASRTSAGEAMQPAPSPSPISYWHVVLATISTAATSASREEWESLLAATLQTGSWPEATESPDREVQDSRAAIWELRRLAGLTWDQLARLFGVARRSLHFWASGKPLNPTNEERLRRLLAVVRQADRGTAEENRAILLRDHDGVIPLDLLVEGKYSEFLELVGRGPGRRRIKLTPLSPEAREARKPPPPEELVGALQDRVHVRPGRLLSATRLRPKREK